MRSGAARSAIALALRIGGSALVFAVGCIAVFFFMRAAPGDPALSALGETASPAAVQAFRAAHHLDLPVWRQFLTWVAGFAIGDFGRSLTIAGGTGIGGLLRPRLVNTAFLGTYALLIAVVLSRAAGAFAARRRGRGGDVAVSSLLILGISMPDFWIAYLLIFGLALGLHMFPAYGFTSPTVSLGGALSTGFLPALAIALPMAAVFARTLRAALLETFDRDYVRTARAFGLPEASIFRHDVLRNALIPYVTVIGLQVRYLLGGVVVIEKVFGVAGLGSLLADAALGRDYPVVQACTVLFLAIVLGVNLAVDAACVMLDPRRAA